MTTNFDFQSHPFVAIWETNARIGSPISDSASPPSSDHLELNDKEAEQLIRDIAVLNPPVFVFAGSDPLQRDRIYSLVQYAADCGLHPQMVLEPDATVTRAALTELKKANLSRLILTLEAGTAQTHDHISGMAGSFARTLQAMRWANDCRLPLQIQTNVQRRNLHELEQIASVLKSFRIVGWSISFPVPQPDESLHDLPSAGEFEEAFALIHRLAQELPFKVKTVEAPHYRRFVVQQRSRARLDASGLLIFPSAENGIPGVLPVNEGRAQLFISSTGEIYPSKALRVSAGNVRQHNLAGIYRNSLLFDSLRDPANLKGKCGDCEFKELCGGSRARAWGVSGDIFGEEPCCSYLPVAARRVG